MWSSFIVFAPKKNKNENLIKEKPRKQINGYFLISKLRDEIFLYIKKKTKQENKIGLEYWNLIEVWRHLQNICHTVPFLRKMTPCFLFLLHIKSYIFFFCLRIQFEMVYMIFYLVDQTTFYETITHTDYYVIHEFIYYKLVKLRRFH